MMITRRKQRQSEPPPFPGLAEATDGSGAVVAVETQASEAAGAYPITPSTQMGEGWALAVAAGKTNVFGRRLIFFEPEGEHAAAAVTAGMSMTGLRATNFSSGQGIAYMHESLYAAAGKRLTYVLHMAARAMTKHALNVHAGHDDYHAIDDTGFFQLFAKDVQSAADLALIAHRIAELSLTPGVCAQDGFLTSHVIESVRLPEPELVKTYLGDPSDRIESPTPAQRLVFGETRRRIPEMFDFDYPAMLGVVQNQDSYAQGVAAQRPFYFDHVRDLADRAMAEYAALTGRAYARARGYRIEDADYVIVGQGSVVANAEAVADHLRDSRGLKLGVLDLTMFRPFPADIVTAALRGKKGVVVLERLDQPLAVELPLLREIRAAMSRALENGRAREGAEPFPDLAVVHPSELSDFYSGGFGFGSRDLQPGDIVAAVENMLPGGTGRRHFYLGIEFIRKNTRLPKLQIWQDKLLESYPQLETLALEPVAGVKLLPEGSLALRIHSVGGWGAITMGKNLALTAFELLGLNIKANPKYGSEKKGQPTTFYATLSPEPVRLNSELRHVDVVLSPDPNVFRHSDPLLGLARGGIFIIQSDLDDAALWASLPASAQADIRERGLRLFALDGFGIASAEASEAELRYRMQGTAFMGAFFAVSPLVGHEGDWQARLFDGIRVQLDRKFGKLGSRVVDDNLRVIRRGFDEVREVTPGEVRAEEPTAPAVHPMPSVMEVQHTAAGVGDPGRFFEQVCALYGVSQDGIADPFAAISAIPAATSAIRDMTNIRFEVPDFVAEKCTGCAQCWTQCPDAAIPGLVHSVEDVLDTAIRTAMQADRENGGKGRSFDRIRQVSRSLSKEAQKLLGGVPFTTFGEVASAAYRNVVGKLGWDADRRAALDDEFAAVYSLLADFPLARTAPFFDSPERREKGSGGLLSITVNPEACKGCNICVKVCPENALVTIKQDADVVDRLRRNWRFWENLPDTADRFINISSIEEGIGVLPSLLLKKDNYRSMVGGDGACMGCGEKTTVHLVTSTIEALMQPRVVALVAKLDGLLAQLDHQARELLAADADLDAAATAEQAVDLTLSADAKERLRRLTDAAAALKDLRWRYAEGPGGRGRANLGISNSTGCSSVWGSTYPYNPYPYPWVNHLFQDSPSVAIGLFEGHMRKMADGFIAVRRAELLVASEYDPAVHEPFFTAFDWHQFSDEEFGLCPPVVAIGGDGAMLDIGFQNLSRLLASGKPIRVVVLDTQVYSNTGGQACTSGFTGQVSDMAAWGSAHHGKEETRKELALIALAHRGVFVHQSSQASASHLIAGVLRGLHARRPAVFNLYTPCPVEHGLADDQSPISAKLALESRAFPFMTYDPDAGDSIAECLSLDGNPALEDDWPVYRLEYVDDAGAAQELELPLTIADWAATETRFRKHFKPLRDDAESELVPFHEFVALAPGQREGKTAFIHTVADDRTLRKLAVSPEIADLARERLSFWAQLRELAAVKPSAAAQDVVADRLEADFAARAEALRAEYDARMAELRESYPRLVARRMAEGLVRAGGSERVADLLARVGRMTELDPITASMVAGLAPSGNGGATTAGPAAQPGPATSAGGAGALSSNGASAQPAAGPAAATTVVAEPTQDDGLVMEPYIETDRCTTCNECTNVNNRMFAYNENRQAYIKDQRAGTFAQLVTAAERCSAGLIHPGTPLNPKEKDLDKWIKRAERFN
jgi:pyruvate-ferredoxin/flavodoxin oxidoreductase